MSICRILATLLFVIAPSLAFAQGAILQYGTITPGHAAKWLQNGAVGDAGGATGGPAGSGLTELGVTNDTPQAICATTGPTTAAYSQICLGFNGANGEISLEGVGQVPTLSFNVNGTTYQFPGTGNGNVVGPNGTTVGHLALWNNTSGTLLEDGGVPVTGPGSTTAGTIVVWNNSSGTSLGSGGPVQALVATNAALKALSISGLSAGYPVFRQGFSAAGDAGAMTYALSTSACALNSGAGDNGYQVAPTTGTGCWIAAFNGPQKPTIWGAVGNGTTDDTTAVQAAITAAGVGGFDVAFDTEHLYKITLTLNVTAPIRMFGPVRYGVWTTSPNNSGRSCSWGLTTTMNQTLLAWTANTGTVSGVCMQLGAATGSGVSATAGAAIAFAPPSTTTYQTGVIATYNTIINPYDGITLNGAGYTSACCGAGTTADGNFFGWNTIINPADAGISIGKNTAGAATVGNTAWDNAIVCINSTSQSSGTGIILYDGALAYDGTENGPEGCWRGVQVIPGTVSGQGQNAQLNPAVGVLGDQNASYSLLIQPQTSLGQADFIECHQCWAASTSTTSTPVNISNPNGGQIDGVHFSGGNFHSGGNASVPVVDIEGGPSGQVQNISFSGTHITCWGGGTCTAPLLKINGIASNSPRDISFTGGEIGTSSEAGGSTCTTGISLGGPATAYVTITGTVGLEGCSTPMTVTGNMATGANGGLYVSNNVGVYPALVQNNPSGPTGTTSTTLVMNGLGVTFTPKTSGNVVISVYGNIGNTVAGDASAIEVHTGTGTPPTNGSASAGTNCMNGSFYWQSINASQTGPFSMTCVLTGLTLGTTYWVDEAIRAITGGTTNTLNNTVTVVER